MMTIKQFLALVPWDQMAVRAEAREEFRHNSDVAEMLCAVCKLLENMMHFDDEARRIPGLPEWWAEHQRRDAAKG